MVEDEAPGTGFKATLRPKVFVGMNKRKINLEEKGRRGKLG